MSILSHYLAIDVARQLKKAGDYSAYSSEFAGFLVFLLRLACIWYEQRRS
jgi:hypothetical protein|tara:strand:- start:81 stop:230 length:150 start_codon:yes stop_codon:yes gene_type:complete